MRALIVNNLLLPIADLSHLATTEFSNDDVENEVESDDDNSENKTKDEKLIADMSKYNIDYQVEKTNTSIKNNAIRTTANKICWALVLLLLRKSKLQIS